MTDNDDYAGLLNARRCALDLTMGIEYVSATNERAIARMPVDGNTQPMGLLHGGASVVLAESLGSMYASARNYPRVALGTEVSATHHRSARGGHVTATCTPLHEGRTMATYEIVVTDEEGRRVCTSRLSVALREMNADSAHLALRPHEGGVDAP